LLDESPPEPKGESPNEDNVAIPGEEPKGFSGEHGESHELGKLLAEPDESRPAGESQKTPAKLIDHAEKLGLKADEVYGLTVALSDGKPKTIGELKDIAQKAVDFEAANLELETKRQEQDSQFTRLKGELMELVGALPKAALTRENFAKAAERYDARLKEAKQAADAAIDAMLGSNGRGT